MKRIAYVCWLFVFLLLSMGNIVAVNPIKILDFNVRKSGEKVGYQVRPFADLILDEDPDLVALQEVDYMMSRSGNKDFLTELSAYTGYFPVFAKAIETDGGEYGVAVLSKYPISSSKIVPLSVPEGTKEKRVALVCDVELLNGQYVRMVSTHLDNSTDEVRYGMVQDLNSSRVLSGDLPVILCGDFNARPDDDAIAAGMARWKWIGDATSTFPSSNPTSKIDYMFVYPPARWNVLDYKVGENAISDHCYLVGKVEMIK